MITSERQLAVTKQKIESMQESLKKLNEEAKTKLQKQAVDEAFAIVERILLKEQKPLLQSAQILNHRASKNLVYRYHQTPILQIEGLFFPKLQREKNRAIALFY